MKNLLSSYLFKPYGHPVKAADYLLELEDDSPTSALTQGLYHQLEDWVALELTAEQMLSNEVNLVSAYVAGDTRQMWNAIKDSLLPYELAAGQMLLRAADPTRVEWLQRRWWGDQESPLH